MRVLFRPEARLEALEAQAWYESRMSGLGLVFARSLEAVVVAATGNPEAYSIVEGECRRVLLRKFPFSLVYRMRADELLVVALFHHRRDPSQLAGRVER